MSDDHELTDLEKLRIGGYMAPALRSGASNPKRAVKVVAKDGSVREATLGEVQKGLLLAHEIAFDVAEKTPETTYACIVCAKEFAQKPGRGRASAVCEGCRSVRCACGAPVSRYAMSPSAIAGREGRPPSCKKCSSRKGAQAGWKAVSLKARNNAITCACGKALSHSGMTRARANQGKPRCRACYLARGHQPKP